MAVIVFVPTSSFWGVHDTKPVLSYIIIESGAPEANEKVKSSPSGSVASSIDHQYLSSVNRVSSTVDVKYGASFAKTIAQRRINRDAILTKKRITSN